MVGIPCEVKSLIKTSSDQMTRYMNQGFGPLKTISLLVVRPRSRGSLNDFVRQSYISLFLKKTRPKLVQPSGQK